MDTNKNKKKLPLKTKIFLLAGAAVLLVWSYKASGNLPQKQPGDDIRSATTLSAPATVYEETTAEQTTFFETAETSTLSVQIPVTVTAAQSQSTTAAEPQTQPTTQTPATVSAAAEQAPAQDAQKSCTLSVGCATILDNIAAFDQSKLSLVPADGIILPPQKVAFEDGDTVFDVLKREMIKNNIHLEFSQVPMYDSVYIEGINNIYEFDCGELSGWMYTVNGTFPGYGCNMYKLQDGDTVEWLYTCDLGRDIGGEQYENGR